MNRRMNRAQYEIVDLLVLFLSTNIFGISDRRDRSNSVRLVIQKRQITEEQVGQRKTI